jgi:hypothetical protein
LTQVRAFLVLADELTAGPAIEHRARALAVSRDHPLAARGSASAEDLAG